MPGAPNVAWVEEHFTEHRGFPRPDWEAIGGRIRETVGENRWNETWDAAAQFWLHRTAAMLGPDYRLLKSRNFLLLVPGLGGEEDALLQSLERSLKTVLESLPGIASDDGFGRHAALVLDSHERYYDYVDWFHPDGGAYPFSGGMFLPEGYGHFVLPWDDLFVAERTVAHELAHACLGHLPIPAWLNEGMASVIENIATGGSARLLTPQEVRDQRSYWNAETIQLFWSGGSFHRPIDGFELGYTLGYLLVKSLARDLARFRAFVLRARAEDAGESAHREVYSGSLAAEVSGILGPGDWRPRPGSWVAGERPSPGGE